MARIDYMEDEDGDLLFENGDLVRGESDYKHVKDLLISCPGHWVQHPTTGLNPYKYAKLAVSPADTRQFKRDAKVLLESDGYKKVEVDVSKGFENMEVVING